MTDLQPNTRLEQMFDHLALSPPPSVTGSRSD